MTYLNEMTCVIVNWIHVNQNRVRRRAVAKTVTDQLAPRQGGKVLDKLNDCLSAPKHEIGFMEEVTM